MDLRCEETIGNSPKSTTPAQTGPSFYHIKGMEEPVEGNNEFYEYTDYPVKHCTITIPNVKRGHRKDCIVVPGFTATGIGASLEVVCPFDNPSNATIILRKVQISTPENFIKIGHVLTTCAEFDIELEVGPGVTFTASPNEEGEVYIPTTNP